MVSIVVSDTRSHLRAPGPGGPRDPTILERQAVRASPNFWSSQTLPLNMPVATLGSDADRVRHVGYGTQKCFGHDFVRVLRVCALGQRLVQMYLIHTPEVPQELRAGAIASANRR